MTSRNQFAGARLDLSAPVLEPGAGGNEQFGEAPIALFVEDPKNPRTEYAGARFDQLVDSIRLYGVITPVTAYPLENGNLQLVTGHRRFRAAKIVGLPNLRYSIPTESQRGAYVQLAENAKRDDISPFEKARVVATLIEAGELKKDIAAKMGLDPADVTALQALSNAPQVLVTLYQAGKCHTLKYLYDIRRLYAKNPTLVERRCAAVEEVTRYWLAGLDAEVHPDRPETTTKATTQKRSFKDRVAVGTSDAVFQAPLMFQGRPQTIVRVVLRSEDGNEHEVEGDALAELKWAAAVNGSTPGTIP
jgi:ParB/RepB/Spo0J family partition protein